MFIPVCTLQDSIISDGSHVGGNIKNCLVGRSQEVFTFKCFLAFFYESVLKHFVTSRDLQVNGAHENETILASDRMMEALVALQSFDPGTFQNKSFQW